MTLQGLQSALHRIQEIQARFDAPAPVSMPSSGEGFEGALSNAIQASQEADATAFDDVIQEQGASQGIDPNLLKAVIRNESNFNPRAVSRVGAQGLMQLMPETAKGLGVQNSLDPLQNITGGAKYLKGLLQKYKSVPNALAAYNAGPGAVDKYHGVPPYAETTQYVQKVMQSYQAYQKADAADVAMSPQRIDVGEP